MFISVKDLAIQPVRISEVLAPGIVDLRSVEFTQSGPLLVEAVATLISGEIRIQGRLEVQVETFCSRCLESMQLPVQKGFDLFYRSHQTLPDVKRVEEIELKSSELDVGFYVGGGLELKDTLREQVLIEMPMKPVCRPDCQGLCSHCGVNLNLASCHCVAEGDDPRGVELKTLKKR